jgi:hypothetical protein
MQITKTIVYVGLAVSLIGGVMTSTTQAASDKVDHIRVTPEAVQ